MSGIGQSHPSALNTAKMTASTTQAGVIVKASPLHIDEIPAAMDKMGWIVAAKMMRRWFATSPAYIMPESIRVGMVAPNKAVDYRKLPQSQIDQSIIKMQWLLGFPPAKAAYDLLLETWDSPLAINRLKTVLLKNANWKPGASVSLGSATWDAIDLDWSAQINRVLLGAYSDELDDLYGAVFKATLKMAVVGKTYYSTSQKSDVFEVDKLGIYLRDTYDFNTSPLLDEVVGLGVWSRERILTKFETIDYKSASAARKYHIYPDFVPVRNKDFSLWQAAQGTGGDFFVFSNVEWAIPKNRFIRL